MIVASAGGSVLHWDVVARRCVLAYRRMLLLMSDFVLIMCVVCIAQGYIMNAVKIWNYFVIRYFLTHSERWSSLTFSNESLIVSNESLNVCSDVYSLSFATPFFLCFFVSLAHY